jgi:nucleotide-binding universal stress UspA family protein
MKRIERIVVGTDFSASAERALDDALDLAQMMGGTVLAVHAYEVPALSLPDGVVISPGLEQTLAKAGMEGLAAVEKRAASRGFQIRTVLRVGAPWDEISAVAAEEKADLIVIGTHGRRGFSRALLGSVAERVVRTATLPVLVVRAVPSSGSST